MADSAGPETEAPRQRTRHDLLIEKLVRAEGLKDERCIHAMRSVDRGLFVQPGLPQDWVYEVREATCSSSSSTAASNDGCVCSWLSQN
jgi:protein-L-isoaspartate O-methyltransferase